MNLMKLVNKAFSDTRLKCKMNGKKDFVNTILSKRILGNRLIERSYFPDFNSIFELEEALLNADWKHYKGNLDSGLIVLKTSSLKAKDGIKQLSDVNKRDLVYINSKNMPGRFENAVIVDDYDNYRDVNDTYIIISSFDKDKGTVTDKLFILDIYSGYYIDSSDTLKNEGKYALLITKNHSNTIEIRQNEEVYGDNVSEGEIKLLKTLQKTGRLYKVEKHKKGEIICNLIINKLIDVIIYYKEDIEKINLKVTLEKGNVTLYNSKKTFNKNNLKEKDTIRELLKHTVKDNEAMVSVFKDGSMGFEFSYNLINTIKIMDDLLKNHTVKTYLYDGFIKWESENQLNTLYINNRNKELKGCIYGNKFRKNLLSKHLNEKEEMKKLIDNKLIELRLNNNLISA